MFLSDCRGGSISNSELDYLPHVFLILMKEDGQLREMVPVPLQNQ